MDRAQQVEFLDYLFDYIDSFQLYLRKEGLRIQLIKLFLDNKGDYGTDPISGEKLSEDDKAAYIRHIQTKSEIEWMDTEPQILCDRKFFIDHRIDLELISNATQRIYDTSLNQMEELDSIESKEEIKPDIIESVENIRQNISALVKKLVYHYETVCLYTENFKVLSLQPIPSLKEFEKSRDLIEGKRSYTNKEIAYAIEVLFGKTIAKLSKSQKLEILGLITSRGANDIYQHLSGNKLQDLNKSELDLMLNPILERLNSNK